MSKWLQKKSREQKKAKKIKRIIRADERRKKQQESISTFHGNLPGEITVYTDGACEPNPGPGGWGAVIVKDDMVIELGGHESLTTNNQMELRAALEALKFLSGTEGNIRIRSDSTYVCNSCSKWAPKWKKNGWLTTAGKPVSNVGLIKKIIALEKSIRGKVTWEPLRGHFGIPGNERADEIADGFVSGEAELHKCPLVEHPYDFAKLMKPSTRKEFRRTSREPSDESKQNGFDPMTVFFE